MVVPVLAFCVASLLVAGAAMGFSASGTSAIERRLGEIAIGGGNGETKTEQSEYRRAIIDALKRVGAAAPKSASEMGKLQQRLVASGYRSGEAMLVFFGIRLACALAG